MTQEREISLRVDTQHMPNLELYPHYDIEQTYFTPTSVDTSYPETEKAEWRVRKIVDGDGVTSFTTTLKFGDKASGSRTELETGIDSGAFGTSRETKEFAYASLLKRRYDLGNGLIVDRLLSAKGSVEYIAEKEFSETEDQYQWGCPDWLSPDQAIVSNRKLAVDLKPKYANGFYEEHLSEADLYKAIEKIKNPTIVSVAGMSGSGKSTIARKIGEKLDAVHIDTDMLHIGSTELKRRFGSINHDLVETYDYARAASIARNLAAGVSDYTPVYDYVRGEPTGEARVYVPSSNRNVVVDGLYASEVACHLRNSSELDVKSVLVDTPIYVSLIRRMLRDCASELNKGEEEREVAFTPEESLKYLVEIAIPTYLKADYDKNFDYIVGR